MEVHCIRCRRQISRQFLVGHQRGPKCQADELAGELLRAGLVPYPVGNDLPTCIPQRMADTRARYEGARLDDAGAVLTNSRKRHRQLWVPGWVRPVTGAWARAGRAHRNRRDRVLCALYKLPQERLQVLLAPGLTDAGVLTLVAELVPDQA